MNEHITNINEIYSHPKVLGTSVVEGILYVTVEDPNNPPFSLALNEGSQDKKVIFIGRMNG